MHDHQSADQELAPASAATAEREPAGVDASAHDALAGDLTGPQWAAMTFQPLPIDLKAFGADWDQTRGDLARSAITLLHFNDQELTRCFLAKREPLRKALVMQAQFQREIDYLLTHIDALRTVSARLLCVASRCEHL